jgi:NitT/TauT family transport system substrate-binding protein
MRFGLSRLACMISLWVAVCAPGQAKSETITVTHWGDSFYGAPYAVAMAKGFFKAKGVDVTGVLTSQGGGTSVRNTLAGDLPFGEVALSAAIEAINNGVPIKIIGGGVQTVADILWVAKKGSDMHGLKSIEGHRVGFTAPGSVTNMILLMAMRENGIDTSKVKMVPVGGVGANTTAVLNGAVDTAMSGEPVWTENIDKLQPVFWTKDVMSPAMMQTVTVTTSDYAKEKPETLRALLEARRMGVEYIEAHPDESAEIVARAYSSSHVDLYKAVFHNFVAIHYWSKGEMDRKGMDRMVEGLEIVGKLKGKVDWSKVSDASFLPPDLRQ